MTALYAPEFQANRINAAPEGANATVCAVPSWQAFRPASPVGAPAKFDARAAGRRAVLKHRDALRRLSD